MIRVAFAVGLALALAACESQPKPTPARAPAIAAPPVVKHSGQFAELRKTQKRVAVPLPRPRPVVPTPPPVPRIQPQAPEIKSRASEIKPAAPQAPAEFVPTGAVQYAPILVEKQRARWPDAPVPWTLGGLVEQETCASLKSKRCWNPREELKTYREYGFGLGQVTIAYKADGSERFNKFTELKRSYASLRSWTWDNRYDPGYQLTAIVEMTLALWRQVPPAADGEVQWAFTLVSYNAGLGGLLQDRRLCGNSAGCDPTRWFGHIETHSLKSKAPQKAYGGQSWYSISRGYVRNVLDVRRAKYRRFWE